jgi:hypothetical protein
LYGSGGRLDPATALFASLAPVACTPFRGGPESDQPLIRYPPLGTLIHAPSAAVPAIGSQAGRFLQRKHAQAAWRDGYRVAWWCRVVMPVCAAGFSVNRTFLCQNG